MKTIDVFTVSPSAADRKLKIIKVENNLESFQKLVGGWIEEQLICKISPEYHNESEIKEFAIYGNEEALLGDIHGFTSVSVNDESCGIITNNFFIIGIDKDGEFISVDPNAMISYFKFSIINQANDNFDDLKNEILGSLKCDFVQL